MYKRQTLEEAVIADFLIHVLDASAPEIFAFYETTLSVLQELKAADKPTIIVLNKIDLIDDESRLHELKRHFDRNSVFVSIHTGEGIPALINRLADMMVDRVSRMSLRLPQARQDLVALLHREGKFVNHEYEGNDILVTAIIPHALRHHFEPFRNPAVATGTDRTA